MMPSCDHTGLPHFHSSTTSGSAPLMSLRILLRISPRQSPSSAILFEMSSDADWPWLASDFFMVSSSKVQRCSADDHLTMAPHPTPSRPLNPKLPGVLGVQSLPAVELQRLGADDAPQGLTGEQPIEHIEADVPPGSTHRDEAAIDAGPQRQACAAPNSFQLPADREAPPGVLERSGSVGPRHGCFGHQRRGRSHGGELHGGSSRTEVPIG